MKQTRLSVNHRRSELMELIAKGITNQRKLARILHTSPATISRDLEFITKRSTKNLHDWIDNKLPLSLKSLLIGNEMIIKKAWELLEKNEHKDELEERRFRLEVLQFIDSLYWHKRNYLIDTDSVVYQIASRHVIPIGKE